VPELDKPPVADQQRSIDLQDNQHQEDLASDADDIRQQAKEARDPEKGENIL
jgi:hypothetical protein